MSAWVKAFPLMSLVAVAVSVGAAASAATVRYAPPAKVSVRPVFFVAKDQRPPTAEQGKRLMKHMLWAQKRYRQMLGGRDSFTLAGARPATYRAGQSLAFYRKQPENAAPHYLAELLKHHKVNRFTCPYLFVIVVMNPRDGFPGGGGRPINGGLNTGGGIVILSSRELDRNKNFQSTLQHELGHGFGLPHVNVYGRDMRKSPSIMSYNPAHHTRGFQPGRSPGELGPDDIRGLAMNRRAFAKLTFDPAKDVPSGYKMPQRMVWLGPMKIPGQLAYRIKATTSAGEVSGSSVQCAVLGQIKPSRGPGITYDPRSMWHSGPVPTGWAPVELTFPCPVRLTGLAVHSQHSAGPHRALRVKIEAGGGSAGYRGVAEQPLEKADDSVTFPAATAKQWKLSFATAKGGRVVIRGLRFFDGRHEIFPPFVPYLDRKPLAARGK